MKNKLFTVKNAFLVLFLCAQVKLVAAEKPNIIVILADDMGYSDIGCYGGEINTPNIDKLAENGIKYAQFYNGARCCPTRASLISGVYAHQAGMGWMTNANLGTHAYQGDLSDKVVTIPEVLKEVNYSTYMTGKWHLSHDKKNNANITDSWPYERGFERYFGIIGGASSYYNCQVCSNNNRYPSPSGFYTTDAFGDSIIEFIEDHYEQTPEKPFFSYLAYTAPHWPLHASPEDIAKYDGVYDVGWDVIRSARLAKQKELGLFSNDVELSPRGEGIEAWDSLTESKKTEYAKRMQVYAAQVEVMDAGIGRLVDKLEELHILDNTLILFLSDNGACAEYISSGQSTDVDGEVDTYESYRMPWANVSATPFREYKHWIHEGGIATPLIAQWSNGIDANLNNTIIREYGHIMDIMATCVELSGATYPTEYNGNNIPPMEGKSLVPHFTGASNNRGLIYWEHEGNIGVRDGKWKLVAKTAEDAELDVATLELFDMESDPAEANNLAKSDPNRVAEMFTWWDQWATDKEVYPIDTRNYNVRKSEYEKQINGEFDFDFLGWVQEINEASGAEADITIDESAVISGENSALIVVENSGTMPNQIQLNWPIQISAGEKYLMSFKAKANKNTTLIVRLEENNDDFTKVIDKTVNLSTTISTFLFESTEVLANDEYKLVFYVGKNAPGDSIWIDGVELAENNELIPVIEAQKAITKIKNQPFTLDANDFYIPASGDNFSIVSIAEGENYSVDGLTVTPDDDFEGFLILPVAVNDGFYPDNDKMTSVLVLISEEPIIEGLQINNGNFDYQFSGWEKETTGSALANFSIENNAVKIEIGSAGDRANRVHINWPFYGKVNDKFYLKFKVKANRNTSLLVRVEENNDDFTKLLDETIDITTENQEFIFETSNVTKADEYKLVFYLGQNPSGDVLTISDIYFSTNNEVTFLDEQKKNRNTNFDIYTTTEGELVLKDRSGDSLNGCLKLYTMSGKVMWQQEIKSDSEYQITNLQQGFFIAKYLGKDNKRIDKVCVIF